MSRLKGGSAGEPVRGFTLSYFHDNVKGIELQTKNTYGLRLLPAFQTNSEGAVTDPLSVASYRDVNHLDPESNRPVFTEWYFPIKVHKMVGSGDRTFVSPLILEGRDCKDVDPLHNMWLVARNSENADWQKLVKKEEDEYNAILARYRVMYVANCIASIDNKIENRALVMPSATLIDLKRKLNQRAGRGDVMLDPDWPDYCFGDVTSVQHGLWATVKAGVFNDAGMKTSLFFFGTSPKDDQPVGVQQYPLVDAWGQAFLAGRYNIGDTEKVTKISTAEEIVAYAADDDDWPYELVQQACGHRWDVPDSHRSRKTFVAPVGAPAPVAAPPAPGMPPAPTPAALPVAFRKFWIVIMGEVKGPFPEALIQQSVNNQGDIQVCLDGTQAWQPASIFGIRAISPAAPTLPAAPAPPAAPVPPAAPAPPAAPVAPVVPVLAPAPPTVTSAAPPAPGGAPPRPPGPPPAPGGAPPRPSGPPAPGMPPRPTPVQPAVASAPAAPPAGSAPPSPTGPVPQTATQPLAQPAAAAVSPLSEAELAEAKGLLAQWTSNNGSGGALLEPDKIARFSELSDRATAAGQSLV